MIELLDALETVTEHWSPRVVAQVNDQYVKVAKLKGQIAWHDHADEDELFWVLKGNLRIEYEDRHVDLGPGMLHVVPRGVRHNPVASEECWIVLIETTTTRHTGDVDTPLTKTIAQQISG